MLFFKKFDHYSKLKKGEDIQTVFGTLYSMKHRSWLSPITFVKKIFHFISADYKSNKKIQYKEYQLMHMYGIIYNTYL